MRQYSLFFLFILGSSVSAESNPQVNVGGRLSNFLNIVQNFTDGTDNTVDDRIVDGIQSALQGLPNRTSNNTVGEIINSTLTNFWDRVQDLADGTNTEIDDTIVDTLTNASQTLREGLGNVLDLYQNATANGTGVVNRTKDFVDGFRNSTDETEPIGDQIIDGLTFVWNRIQDGLANSRDFINTMRPCHEIAPRCGLAGYRLRKGTPGTATCEEICSTFPVVRRDYECGVCGPAVPTAAPIPAPVAPVMPVAPTPVAPTPVAPPMVAPTPVAPPPTDPAPTAPAPVAAPTPVASPPTDPAPTPTVPTPTATPPTVPAPTASTPVAPPSSTASAPTDPATSFELTLEYGGVPDGDKVFFETAATRWQRIIKGDVPDYDTSSITKTPDHSDCTLPGTVDDIYLCVYYTTIDGVGGTAGNGGWQWRRTADANGNRIPVMGYMRFESVDIPDAKSQGWWQNLIIHELGHVLGIGTQWTCPVTTTKIMQEWQTLSGCNSAPLSDSSCNHWDDTCFGDEVMAPAVSPNSLLSRLTVAALEDLGYTVDYAEADSGYNSANLDPSCSCRRRELTAVKPLLRGVDDLTTTHKQQRHRQLSEEGRQNAQKFGLEYLEKKRKAKAPNDGEEIVVVDGAEYVEDCWTIVLYIEFDESDQKKEHPLWYSILVFGDWCQ